MDLVSRFIRGITRATILVIGAITYFLSPPDPPSRVQGFGFRVWVEGSL